MTTTQHSIKMHTMTSPPHNGTTHFLGGWSNTISTQSPTLQPDTACNYTWVLGVVGGAGHQGHAHPTCASESHAQISDTRVNFK